MQPGAVNCLRCHPIGHTQPSPLDEDAILCPAHAYAGQRTCPLSKQTQEASWPA